MNKGKFIVFLLTILFTLTLSAQSDYQIVQSFKEDVSLLKRSIESADSMKILDSLETSIDSLSDKYIDKKELLDKSLYPEDFGTVIGNLRNKLALRKKDFEQVDTLQTQVVKLRSDIQQLNDKNEWLLSQITELKTGTGGDAESVVALKKLVSELKKNLRERDELVMSMVDSLLSQFVENPAGLNEAERSRVYKKVESGNLFYNIEKTIRDNMQFLKVTELQPEDLGEVKEDQLQFYELWKRIGPRLSEVYAETGNKTGEVAYITNLFSQWSRQIDEEIWKNVQKVFRERDIKFPPIRNGNDFTQTFTSYIDERINSVNQVGYDQSLNLYKEVRDTIWNQELKTNWVPVLIDNQMMTTAQKDSIDEKFDEWKALYKTETSYWWYIIIAAIIIIALIIFVPKWKGRESAES